MAYYRVLDTQFEVNPEEPPLDIALHDIQHPASKMLGFAKLGWSKRYFCTINGFLYQFKEDISSVTSTANIPKAMSAWDLQLIDAVLDENGKRSGSKFAVLIINGDKTISLKFASGPEAVMFFAALKQQWTAIRGLYYVDFGEDPPIWSGEANGPQPIGAYSSAGAGVMDPQSPSFSPSLSKKKSSVYLPKDGVANGIISPKDQDVVILQYIDEYEAKKKKQQRLAKGPGAAHGDGDSESEFSSGSGMEFEDSDRFETSRHSHYSEESEDPLYRQVSQMTSEQKADLGIYRYSTQSNSPQSQFNRMTGYPNGGGAGPGMVSNRSSLVMNLLDSI